MFLLSRENSPLCVKRIQFALDYYFILDYYNLVLISYGGEDAS